MAKGSRGGEKRSANKALSTYESLPYAFRVNSSYATKEEKALRKSVLDKFMSEAAAGNVYSAGGGFGSSGNQFKIVQLNKSKNKMGLKWINSSNRPVQLDRKNAENFIANGARLVKREKSLY